MFHFGLASLVVAPIILLGTAALAAPFYRQPSTSIVTFRFASYRLFLTILSGWRTPRWNIARIWTKFVIQPSAKSYDSTAFIGASKPIMILICQARSGMGSSSAFAVALLHALYAYRGKMVSHRDLALQAIHIEREVLKESVGSQDQAAVAHGGFNHIRFETDDSLVVTPMILGRDTLQELSRHLMLYFTGTIRFASEIAKTYCADLGEKERNMRLLGELVPVAIRALQEQKLLEFGHLLHEGWRLKRSIASAISTDAIDEIYKAAIDAGALGGKILGAGGGGFMLLFVPPENQPAVRERLKSLLLVPFEFRSAGSQIIYYDPENAGHEAVGCPA